VATNDAHEQRIMRIAAQIVMNQVKKEAGIKMGIDTHFYTMHGVKTKWNDEFHDAYDEVYDDNDTPFVLMESMCGEYMIFGTVLYDSGNLRWGEINNDCVEIDIGKLHNLEFEYRKEFEAKFPQFVETLLKEPFKLMTFAHYS
jgi:hypothetical protein